MSEELTKRQQEILDYLRKAHRETGIMPSTREIQHYFGFASQTAAMSHLRVLERKGAIQRLPGKARAVVFPEDLDRGEMIDVPVYGQIAAANSLSDIYAMGGKPIMAIAILGWPISKRR